MQAFRGGEGASGTISVCVSLSAELVRIKSLIITLKIRTYFNPKNLAFYRKSHFFIHKSNIFPKKQANILR